MIRFSISILFILVSSLHASKYINQQLQDAKQLMQQQTNFQGQSTQGFQNFTNRNQFSQNRNQQLGFSQLNRVEYKKRDEKHGPVKVYELVDLNSLKRHHPNFFFIEDHQYRRLASKLDSKSNSTNGLIQQESIHLDPDFEKQRLNLSYEFEIQSNGKTLLLETNKDFQIHEALLGYELLPLEIEDDRQVNRFYAQLTGQNKIVIKASVALHSLGFTGEYEAYLPVAFAAAHRLTHKRNLPLEVELISGVRNQESIHFANLFNPITVKFRKKTSQNGATVREFAPITMPPQNFKRKRTLINWTENLHWERPFIYRNHAVFISKASRLNLNLPSQDLLLSVEVIQGSKHLQQGIDFGLSRTKDLLEFEFHDDSENLKIRVSTASSFAAKQSSDYRLPLPFQASAFEDNFYSLRLHAKEGQILTITQLEQLQNFAKTRTSVNPMLVELKNVEDTDLRLNLEERELVALSSVRCSSYTINSQYRGNNFIRLEIDLRVKNTGSQFLNLQVPKNYKLVHARIENQKLIPAREGEQNYLLPLKLMKDRSDFLIHLAFDAQLAEGENKVLQLPVPEVDVDHFHWTFWAGDVDIEFANEHVHFESRQKGTNKQFSSMTQSPGRVSFVASSQGFPRTPEVKFKVKALKSKAKKIKRDYSLMPFLMLLLTGLLFRISRQRVSFHPWIRLLALTLFFIALELYWFQGNLLSIFIGSISFEQRMEFFLFYSFYLIQYLSWDLLETRS